MAETSTGWGTRHAEPGHSVVTSGTRATHTIWYFQAFLFFLCNTNTTRHDTIQYYGPLLYGSPHTYPARSMRDSFDSRTDVLPMPSSTVRVSTTCSTAWDLDDTWLAPVASVRRLALPCLKRSSTSSLDVTSCDTKKQDHRIHEDKTDFLMGLGEASRRNHEN